MKGQYRLCSFCGWRTGLNLPPGAPLDGWDAICCTRRLPLQAGADKGRALCGVGAWAGWGGRLVRRRRRRTRSDVCTGGGPPSAPARAALTRPTRRARTRDSAGPTAATGTGISPPRGRWLRVQPADTSRGIEAANSVAAPCSDRPPPGGASGASLVAAVVSRTQA